MEWLIVLLLVPAIVVPIVLLCGFAGCSFCVGIGSVTSPTVTATPTSIDHFTVSWLNTEPTVVGYRFVRKKGTEIQKDLQLDPSITTVEDPDPGLVGDPRLEEGTEYTYEVTTSVELTSCDETHTYSSQPGTVAVRTFSTAFAVDAAAVSTDQTIAPDNYCFVQRIPAAQLLAAGSKVGVSVQGAPAGNVTINSIYISRGASSGNPWNSDTDIKAVRTSPLTLANDQPVELEPIDYTLDQTQDLIIAFDFTATSGADHIRRVPPPGVSLYFKQGVQQASVPTRDPNYVTQPDPRLYLVVRIGVL